jgi:hypothetical protein
MTSCIPSASARANFVTVSSAVSTLEDAYAKSNVAEPFFVWRLNLSYTICVVFWFNNILGKQLSCLESNVGTNASPLFREAFEG